MLPALPASPVSFASSVSAHLRFLRFSPFRAATSFGRALGAAFAAAFARARIAPVVSVAHAAPFTPIARSTQVARITPATLFALLAFSAMFASIQPAHAQTPSDSDTDDPIAQFAQAAPQAPPQTPRYLRITPKITGNALPSAVTEALARARVPFSALGVVIEKVGAPQPLVAVHADTPMLPASTMKLVTTYSGLRLLGPDYRWRTRAYASGSVDASGALHGNLYIQGSGDPRLVPDELADLVQKIRAAGIRRLDGALVLDKSAFAAATRDLPSFDGDARAPYDVGPDPLLYAFKALTFTLSPNPGGPGGGVAISTLPPLAQLQIDNRLVARRGACPAGAKFAPRLSATGAGVDSVITASFGGRYPTGCGDYTGSIAAPVSHSTFFASGFLALWQQAGGELGPDFSHAVREEKTPVGARLVATHDSAPLADIVHDINKFSNNVMARNLFLTLGEADGQPPTPALTPASPSTPAKAASAIAAFLRRNGIAMPDLALDNGCGLSRSEHVSALSMASLLQSASASPVFKPFVDSLPSVGVDGTMRHRLTNSPVAGNAQIKTGTLRDVRAIAGYVEAANGDTYIVVSMINHPNSQAARPAHDALIEWVYRGMPQE